MGAIAEDDAGMSVAAQAALDDEPAWYDDLLVNAFVSVATVHNFSVVTTRRNTNQLRFFDTDNDSIKVDVAEVVLQMEPEVAGAAGFRLDVVHGVSIPVVMGGIDIGLQQGFVSYIAPLGSGLTLDAGTFMSRMGGETIEGYDNYNDTYSRGLLFRYAMPQILTGLRAHYNLAPTLQVTGLVVNGWAANVLDNNTGKSLGLQLALNPNPTISISAHYLGGPEKDNNNRDWRHLFNLVVVLRAQPLTLTLDGVMGLESTERAASRNWLGVGGTVRWDLDGRWAVAARSEYFDDSDGQMNIGGRVAEVTVTPSFKINDSTIVRAEVRQDIGLDSFTPFLNKQGFSGKQTTAALNALFVF